MELSALYISFCFYALLGWICETVYCSILFKKFTNRGFLNGPVCPIYGVGGLLLLKTLELSPKNPFLIFIVGAVVTTALEYVTGLLLEKLFHAKWWDYSQNRFNYKGRICLLNSVLFGLLSVSLIYLLEPFVSYLIGLFTVTERIVTAAVFAALMLTDLAVTVRSMNSLNLRLESLSRAFSAVKEKLDASGFYNALNVKERLERLHEILDTDAGRAIYKSLSGIRERIGLIEGDNRAIQRRLIRAFPDLRSTRYPELLGLIKEKILRSKNESGARDAYEEQPEETGSNKLD